MKEQLNDLRFKRAALFCKIEATPNVSKKLFAQFGKVCMEIILLEKQLNRAVKPVTS